MYGNVASKSIRPLTYNGACGGLRAGQFRLPTGGGIFSSTNIRVTNNYFGGGYSGGYSSGFMGGGFGMPSWMKWTMGIQMFSGILGSLSNLFGWGQQPAGSYDCGCPPGYGEKPKTPLDNTIGALKRHLSDKRYEQAVKDWKKLPQDVQNQIVASDEFTGDELDILYGITEKITTTPSESSTSSGSTSTDPTPGGGGDATTQKGGGSDGNGSIDETITATITSKSDQLSTDITLNEKQERFRVLRHEGKNNYRLKASTLADEALVSYKGLRDEDKTKAKNKLIESFNKQGLGDNVYTAPKTINLPILTIDGKQIEPNANNTLDIKTITEKYRHDKDKIVIIPLADNANSGRTPGAKPSTATITKSTNTKKFILTVTTTKNGQNTVNEYEFSTINAAKEHAQKLRVVLT